MYVRSSVVCRLTVCMYGWRVKSEYVEYTEWLGGKLDIINMNQICRSTVWTVGENLRGIESVREWANERVSKRTRETERENPSSGASLRDSCWTTKVQRECWTYVKLVIYYFMYVYLHLDPLSPVLFLYFLLYFNFFFVFVCTSNFELSTVNSLFHLLVPWLECEGRE